MTAPAPEARVRYARSRGALLSYHDVGDGPVTLVGPCGAFYPVAALLQEEHLRAYVTALARHVRLLLVDRRGLGYSDPFGAGEAAPTLDEEGQDLLAVLDDAGVEQAALHVIGFDGQALLQLAAERPDRVSACVIASATPRLSPGEGWDHGANPDLLQRWRHSLDPAGVPFDLLDVIAPSRRGDDAYRSWFSSVGRSSAGPATALAYVQRAIDADVRHLVPGIAVPSLVLHTTGNRLVPVGAAHWLHNNLSSCTYDELSGDDANLILGRGSAVGHRIAEFLLDRPLRRPQSATGQTLTPTQEAVAQLVAQGLTNAQVADRLNISTRTVESHVSQAFQRLGITSRSELTALVVRRQPRPW